MPLTTPCSIPRSSRRAFLRALGAGMSVGGVALLSAACGSPAPSAPAPTTPPSAPAQATTAPKPAAPAATQAAPAQAAPAPSRPTTTLVIAQETSPIGNDPLRGQQLLGQKRVATLLYDRPTNGLPDGTIGQGLATEWKTVDDQTWQFKMRPGVKFHDGTALDPEAIKFTIETAVSPEAKNTFAAYTGSTYAVEIVDRQTFNVKTKDPFALMLTGLFLVGDTVPSWVPTRGWDAFLQKPIGTGPFKFVEFRPNDRVVLEANADYWGGRPKLDQVIYRYIPDAATRVAALKAGEVQISSSISPDSAADVQASGNKIVPVLLNRGVSIDFNEQIDHPINKDKRVRQALNYAIDKQTILKDLFRGYGDLMDGQIPQKGTFGYNPNLKPYPYDPDKAKSLLADAGFANGFDMDMQSQNAFGHQEVATAAAAQLGKIGVKVKLDILESGVYANKKADTQLGPAFTSTWSALGDASQNLIWFTSASTLGKYHTNTQWDDLILGANKIIDQPKREQMFQQATAMMYDSPPCIWTIRMADLWAVSSSVQNLEVTAAGYLFALNTSLA